MRIKLCMKNVKNHLEILFINIAIEENCFVRIMGFYHVSRLYGHSSLALKCLSSRKFSDICDITF